MDEFLDRTPIIDVHEHHIPEVFASREVGLLDLFEQSYAGWTQARPYPLPSESRDSDPMLSASSDTTWDGLVPYLEGSGTNAFVRNLVGAIDDLYALDGAGITRGNWKEIDAEVRRRHRDPSWTGAVLDRAGVRLAITDPYTDPLLDAHAALGERYRSVLRINALAFGWHPDRRDHNGNCAHEIAERAGVRLERFEDYEALLERVVETMHTRHQVGLKNALAYDRSLDFDDPDEPLARKAWLNPRANPAEQKAFGDFVVDRLCRLAGERDIPVQMHLGTAIIRGSHPLRVAPLIERHPQTRFLLMHLAYPWSADLLGLAFVYRNIWLDLTWSFLLSPAHFRRALHEAIDVLPDESRLMLGGDNWHAEETYGSMRWARALIGRVLGERIDAGDFGREEAERLARRILHENAAAFFSLDNAS